MVHVPSCELSDLRDVLEIVADVVERTRTLAGEHLVIEEHRRKEAAARAEHDGDAVTTALLRDDDVDEVFTVATPRGAGQRRRVSGKGRPAAIAGTMLRAFPG